LFACNFITAERENGMLKQLTVVSHTHPHYHYFPTFFPAECEFDFCADKDDGKSCSRKMAKIDFSPAHTTVLYYVFFAAIVFFKNQF
jgi:hypothetical protein